MKIAATEKIDTLKAETLQRYPNVFVTGTDTEVGKTVVSRGLLQHYAKQGLTVAGYKPVAAGCDIATGFNDDAETLLQASTVDLDYSQVNPYALMSAKAPHIAAKEEGVALNVQGCMAGVQTLLKKTDRVIVEGAGGWQVPLNEHESLADVAKKLAWPVVIVVGMRLGCLNHAWLTARAIRADGLNVLGWVANCLEPNWPDCDENIEYLKNKFQAELNAPLLARISFLKSPETADLSGFFRL